MTMIGIDPHKATHTAVAVDDNEVVLGEFKVRASSVQAARLRKWAGGFEKREWAVESANGLGYLVAQQLVAAGETVFDVPPVLASRIRLLGSGRSQKNDPNDARSVAIAALRSDRLALVRVDDHARVLRLLAKRHRDMARLRNKHCTRLHALLLELKAGGISSEITVNKANQLLERVIVDGEVTRHRMLIAHELVDDIARLDSALKASKKRPVEVEDRAIPGHWEGDLMIGLQRSAIGTLVERTTRFTMLIHLPREDGYGVIPRTKNGPALAGYGAVTMKNALATTMTTLPQQLRRSLTWDRGKELSAHAEFTVETNIPVYFADPMSPWQRGTNENTNGLLRQYFPKGTDLSRWASDDLEAVAATINSRPRKTLAWKTPAEALDEHLRSLQQAGVASTD